LRAAIETGSDSMFSVAGEDGEETFHFSRRRFRLQGREHDLHLLRRMTRELSRQEVATWKRVIRVMSHELYNSLAPISSLAHTGAELARRRDRRRSHGIRSSPRSRPTPRFASRACFPKPPASSTPGRSSKR
jgi:hypothetical protein